jgi:hypothetical protein
MVPEEILELVGAAVFALAAIETLQSATPGPSDGRDADRAHAAVIGQGRG